jgi:hypothetical protein
MKIAWLSIVAAGLPMLAGAASAQQADASGPAITFDVFASTDADDSDLLKAGVSFDWSYDGPANYQGLRLETAYFSPQGRSTTEDQRVYYRFADDRGDWKWNGQVGTDGDTALGAVSVVREGRIRQEYFVEREIVETPRGLDEGVYYTFAGGSFDVPINDRNSFTFMAGVQDFTGENVRTHLRANYVHVVKPEWGLSAQLRTRYYRSSEPGEYDYFSPEWYAEVMPVVQIRRFHGGWRYQAAVGLGAQKDSGSDWRSARYFEASVISPPIRRDWALKAAAVYSNTPVTTGYAYDYQQISLSLTRAF